MKKKRHSHVLYSLPIAMKMAPNVFKSNTSAVRYLWINNVGGVNISKRKLHTRIIKNDVLFLLDTCRQNVTLNRHLTAHFQGQDNL